MASASNRLSSVLSHLNPFGGASANSSFNFHTLSPTQFLPRAAAIEPDAIAVHHTTRANTTLRRTYAELSLRASHLAHFLLKHSLKRVGILSPNTPAFLEAIYGIAGAGGVNVAINYRLKETDISYIFDHADVDSILVDSEYVSLLASFRRTHPSVRIVVDEDSGQRTGEYEAALSEGAEYAAERGWEHLAAQAASEDDLIAIAYTSGTTSRPKGVEFTHRGAYLAALANVIESGLNADAGRAHYLWTLPMFHAMGWTFPWALTLVRGTHFTLRKIEYGVIWGLLKEHRITHFNAAPTVNTLLCNDPAAQKLEHSVRVTVAASPPTGRLFEMMTELNLWPVHVYGLTETYGPITKGYIMPQWDALPAQERYAKMARQGHGFVTSLPVRVVKPDLPTGVIEDVVRDGEEVGEIVFTGNICARGYYKDAEATKALFAGGVLHSGDLAVWHPDGAIQIIDRGKDIIISGGENISSLALESIIVQHPEILEAAVVAVKDEKWGERPKAFVTVKGGDTKGEAFIRWIKDHPGISGFMVPKEVEVVAELPKTSTGKVRKNVLREWAKGAERKDEQ